jgi:hypothetical protein
VAKGRAIPDGRAIPVKFDGCAASRCSTSFNMFISLISCILTGSLGVMIGMIVGSEQSHTIAVHTLEQKVALLERENETLQEANEEWSEEYEKLSKEQTEAEVKYIAPESLCMPIILVLAGMVIANAVSIYISLILNAKLK